MNAIRIRTRLESETLHLPELKPMVGMRVEIIVLPEGSPESLVAGTGDWSAAQKGVGGLTGYDFDAWQQQREFDRRQAQDDDVE